jgi:hypothetical protein
MTLGLAWLGGICLALLILAGLTQKAVSWIQSIKKRWALAKAEKLDWELIDNTVNADRLRRDCERQESLGICTGRECLVYDECDFNIKKVVH